MSEPACQKLPFKPRARLLLLLGDQLIRDPGIAVFELVKNAYDADSPNASIVMSHVDDKDRGKIVVEDSGTGMDIQTVTNVWLEPGADYRVRQRETGIALVSSGYAALTRPTPWTDPLQVYPDTYPSHWVRCQ